IDEGISAQAKMQPEILGALIAAACPYLIDPGAASRSQAGKGPYGRTIAARARQFQKKPMVLCSRLIEQQRGPAPGIEHYNINFAIVIEVSENRPTAALDHFGQGAALGGYIH